jgi:hypothetical protein
VRTCGVEMSMCERVEYCSNDCVWTYDVPVEIKYVA